MLPLVPIFGWLCAGGGAAVLAWYYNLGEAEQKKADVIANQIAYDLYGVAVEKLNEAQARQVQARVRDHFKNN